MIKNYSFLLISLFIICSCSNNIELTINAEDVYNKRFENLKVLDSSTVEHIINNCEKITGINGLEKIIHSCPIDSIRNNYNTIRIKHIEDFRKKSKFYAFPIVTKSINLDCFLVATNDTNDNYYTSLKIFNINNKDTSSPILLIEYSRLSDGLSLHQTNSECIIYNNKKVISKFIKINEALDLPDFPPDTVINIVEIKYGKDNLVEVINSNKN